MIRQKQNHEIVIDLDGSQGNAFVLLGLAQDFARQCGIDGEELINEMKSGDYNHLVKTFNQNFPFIVLETSQEDLLRELI